MSTNLFTSLQFIFKQETKWDSTLKTKAIDYFHETIRNQTIGQDFVEGTENALLTIVSKSMLGISIPVMQGAGFPYQELKSKLAPSIRKRVKFVDARGNVWRDVKAFFEPIVHDLNGQTGDPGFYYKDRLSWAVYLIILASRGNAEAVVNPSGYKRDIKVLFGKSDLSRESKARLATLSGIFESFNICTEAPKLSFSPNVTNEDLRSRLSEMLEDAYLLEASRLRRFIGLRQNLASVKRDLRLLLTAIMQTRSWAKGIVDIGSEILTAPRAGKATDILFKAITNQIGNNSPILSPWADIKLLTDYRVVTVHEALETGSYCISTTRQMD